MSNNDDFSTPSYYIEGSLSPLEVMQCVMTKEEIEGFLKGNIIKYSIRAGKKPDEPAEKDFKKAQHYRTLLTGFQQGLPF